MKNKGFTLVELIAVITIIGILTLIATGAVTKYIDSSRESSRNNTLHEVEDASLSYGLTQFISDSCSIDFVVDDTHPYSKAGCTPLKVTVDTLIKNGFLKDEANLAKRTGEVIIYKYRDKDSTSKAPELRAFVSESVLSD